MAYWVVGVPCAALISRVNMGSVAMGVVRNGCMYMAGLWRKQIRPHVSSSLGPIASTLPIAVSLYAERMP